MDSECKIIEIIKILLADQKGIIKMAEIKMSYIFLEKEKHESKTIQKIIIEIIDNTVDKREEKNLIVDNTKIKYRIIQKENSNRCFLEMVAKERVNYSIAALKKVDNALFKSNQQRYYDGIRDYDGISENFCKRLYPKYAEFERKLRSLVLFILTKAYGNKWQKKTISEEQLKDLKEKAHGNVSLNETLENVDLSMLEIYLFEKRHVDYSKVINTKLSSKYLKELNKNEICSIIEGMRPTSLWERHFEKFGSQESWMKKIVDVHKVRNKVAHQKTISIEEFTATIKQLNLINKDLTRATEGIREANFTQLSIVDILGSFCITAGRLAKNIVDPKALGNVILKFVAKIQEMEKPSEEIYQNNLSNMLSALGKVSKEYSILIQQENLASTKKFLEAGERFDSKIKEMQESVFNEQ